SVQSHSIDKHRMFKVVSREDTKQLLRSANAEGWHQHGPTTLHDLRNLLDKLLLKPITDRVILHSISSLHHNRVQVLVFGICAVNQPSRLAVEVAGIEEIGRAHSELQSPD